ncbi:unnamed protein product [Symbiodinium sp. CCMP2592]|nr:unnamed protein product [Symbiodinium sp. CCMP2592]
MAPKSDTVLHVTPPMAEIDTGDEDGTAGKVFGSLCFPDWVYDPNPPGRDGFCPSRRWQGPFPKSGSSSLVLRVLATAKRHLEPTSTWQRSEAGNFQTAKRRGDDWERVNGLIRQAAQQLHEQDEKKPPADPIDRAFQSLHLPLWSYNFLPQPRDAWSPSPRSILRKRARMQRRKRASSPALGCFGSSINGAGSLQLRLL